MSNHQERLYGNVNSPFAVAVFAFFMSALALAFRLANFFGLTLDAVFSPETFEPLGNDVLSSHGVA